MKKLTIIALALVSAGCGAAELGMACDEADQCAEGLLCVPTQNKRPDANGGVECQSAGSFCSVSCDGDGDCLSALGAGHICVNECGAGACFVGERG